MKIEQLINDLQKNFETNMEIGDVCDRCKMEHLDNAHWLSETEIELGRDNPNCEKCKFGDCENLSEKYRSYKHGAGFFTDSWLSHAFSDIGADLSPADYGIEDYYGDEVTEAEEKALNDAMEKLCEAYENKK